MPALSRPRLIPKELSTSASTTPSLFQTGLLLVLASYSKDCPKTGSLAELPLAARAGRFLLVLALEFLI
jgi:hypothetical protein